MAPSHAKTRTPGLGAAWAVLIGTGATSVTYNVVHATQGARLEIALALLLGLAPAFVAACLSHIAAVLDAHWSAKAIVTAIMAGGMVLSASATASVIAPAEPGWKGWLFGIILDAGALFALWAIMYSRQRKNEAAMAVEAARADAATARAEAAEIAGERSRLAEELAGWREQSAAELETVRVQSAQQVDAVKAELEAAKTAHAALLERVAASAHRARKAPRKNAQAEDLSTEWRAADLLDKNPSLRAPRMGAELARQLGVSPATGRRLHARLTARYHSGEPLGERSPEDSHERSPERS